MLNQKLQRKLANKKTLTVNGYNFPDMVIAIKDLSNPLIRYFKGTDPKNPHIGLYSHPTKKMNKARTTMYNAVTGKTVAA